ncbi:hypothetical protein GX48_04700 [Paracoccidioides brasiliensis]|nr:hypothetical protein GX48_04700 [Paracoccidioides brasiliensis]
MAESRLWTTACICATTFPDAPKSQFQSSPPICKYPKQNQSSHTRLLTNAEKWGAAGLKSRTSPTKSNAQSAPSQSLQLRNYSKHPSRSSPWRIFVLGDQSIKTSEIQRCINGSFMAVGAVVPVDRQALKFHDAAD